MNRAEATETLIEFWSNENYASGIHDNDVHWKGKDLGREIRECLNKRGSWESTEKQIGDLIKKHPRKVDSSAVPVPFLGNLKSGTIFLLMANPGVAEHRLEETNEPFKKALLENLTQSGDRQSFLYLDERFKDSAAFQYWEIKRGLGSLIKDLSKEMSCGIDQARELLKEHLVVIQAVPYHSMRMPSGPPSTNLPESSNHARQLAQALASEAKNEGNILVICARSHAWWGDIFVLGPRERGPVLIGAKGHGGFTFNDSTSLPWRRSVLDHLKERARSHRD